MVINTEIYKWPRWTKKGFRVLSHKWSIYTTLFLNVQISCRKEGRKNLRDRGDGNSVFWTQQCSYTYELTTVMTTCTRLVQSQVRPNPRMERVCGHELSVPGYEPQKLIPPGRINAKCVAWWKSVMNDHLSTNIWPTRSVLDGEKCKMLGSLESGIHLWGVERRGGIWSKYFYKTLKRSIKIKKKVGNL